MKRDDWGDVQGKLLIELSEYMRRTGERHGAETCEKAAKYIAFLRGELRNLKIALNMKQLGVRIKKANLTDKRARR